MCIGGASRLNVLRVTPLYEGCAPRVPTWGVIPAPEEAPPLPIESLAVQGQLFVICRGQSEGMATARVLHRLALGEGSVGLGVRATCLCSKKHFPSFKPERFGNSLDLACGGGAPALKDVAESRELHPRQAR